MTMTGRSAVLWFTGALLAVPFIAAATPPQVNSIYPPSQRISVPANTVVQVAFTQDINPATVTSTSFKVYGRWSGPESGTLSVTGSLVTFTPTDPFFAGEWVTVSLSRGIQNTLGEGLTQGYAWNFWIKTGSAQLDLTYIGRITTRQGGETWVEPYGAYAGDLDNDGFSDLAVPCEQTSDVRVFMNSSGSFSSFTPISLVNGNTPSPNEGGDFDNDGEIDLVVGNVGNDQISLLFGNGTGAFPSARKTSYTAASQVRGVGILDLNGDGWDDIVTANRFGNNISIFINNGDGSFAPAVYQDTGLTSEYSIGIADANNDGLEDVFVGNFTSPYEVIVMLSNGDGTLTPQTPAASGGQAWQLVVGDFNNDGNVDAAVCNTNQNRMGVLYGDGTGALTAATTYSTGSFPIAIDAGDVDGDGDLELLVSNYGNGTWTLYENYLGTFVNPRTINASSAGSCAIFHDRDNDGDLDITGFDEVDDWIYFYQNSHPTTAVGPTTAASVSLEQNYPNPFNPSTSIRFDLKQRAWLAISIYDATGAFVTTVASGVYPAGAGEVRWDGVDAAGNRVGSGVYFCRLASGDVVLTRKMVLLK